MDRVLKLSILAVIAWASAAGARADDKTHKAAAKDVLKAMDMETQLQVGVDLAVDQMTKSNPALAAKKDQLKKFMSKCMGWGSLEDDFVSMYMKAYTEDELKDIATFYKTPAGKKMVAKTPELAKTGMELGAKKVKDNQAELIKILTEK